MSGLLTLMQLNCLAVMIIVAASGVVSPWDLAFVVFSIFHMYLLFKVAFPRTVPPKYSMVLDPRNKILRKYMMVSAIIGLYLPIAYIFHGILGGDSHAMKAAGPHLFLVTSQVFLERVAFSDRFSIPIGVYIPVLYNSRRIFSLVDWMRSEFDTESGVSGFRVYAGQVIALSNMSFWCFNLFGFLLPVYLPRAFKVYYSESKVTD